MKWVGFFGAAVVALAAGPASAALFVAGDSNMFHLNINTTPPNQQFLANLVDGSNVLVRSSLQLGTGGQALTNYLNGAGYSVSTVGAETAFTAGHLAGQDLVIVMGLTGGFTGAEVTALGDFLDAGGNALVVGENGTFYGEMNDALNAFLSALGSSMRLANNAIGPGEFQTASILTANAYTAGTAGLQYIFTSTVNGGVGLLGTQNEGLAFVSYEPDGYVPEPATWALMIAGFGLTGAALRRRRAAGA